MDVNTLAIGFLIFFARICDVSIGTVRTIVTVQGRSVVAFFLAIFELLIWITVVSTVIHKIKDQPVLALFYAFGYATGNVVGIAVERKIALGIIVLRVFTRTVWTPALSSIMEQWNNEILGVKNVNFFIQKRAAA
jgi:uncharacterized protein YebE (UPF0316 family)